MTLALETAPQGFQARPRTAVAGLSGWDALALAVLLALWAGLFLVRYDALPLQLWDESRNANNALEMARHGRWLTPTYAGVADHWNTKPPLLIWTMAGWLRLGLPPLMAMRLTSWLAAAATVGALWSVLRFGLQDRLAAFAGALLLLSAAIYIGPHAARTGDYDALESAFLFGYVLAFWQAFERGRTRWLFLAAGLMALGVLTKGVAALLPLPGLALYAFTRPPRLGGLLKDLRTWGAAALFIAVVGGYYLAREANDPGYLSAVASNELGGRFLKITEHHRGSWHFYLRALLQSAEPCTPMALLGLFTLFGRDPRRRSLALAASLAAGSLLLVLSVSRSKMEWYAAPLIPLMALVAGLGLSDALHWVDRARPRLATAARALAVALLAGGVVFGLWYNQVGWSANGTAGPHFRYGEFLARMRALQPGGPITNVTVVDTGFHNDAGFAAYDPMLKFYAELSAREGLRVSVVPTLAGLADGEVVASCDPWALRALTGAYRLQPMLVQTTPRGEGCVMARLVSPAR